MESLVQLLDAQYEHTVDYCNAQTSLQNAITPSTASRHHMMGSTTISVASAVQTLQASVSRVQMDLKRLENVLFLDDDENIDDSPGQKLTLDRIVVQGLTHHVERSRRILDTLHSSTSLAPHGIPVVVNTSTATGDDDDLLNTKTIALSTLRASIHQLQEILHHRM
jgi:hypothetical protein